MYPAFKYFSPQNHRPPLSQCLQGNFWGVSQVMTKKPHLSVVKTEGLHQSKAGNWSYVQSKAGNWTYTSQMTMLSPEKTLILLTLQFSQNMHHMDTLLRDCKHRRKRGPDHISVLSFSSHSREEFWIILKAATVLTFPPIQTSSQKTDHIQI